MHYYNWLCTSATNNKHVQGSNYILMANIFLSIVAELLSASTSMEPTKEYTDKVCMPIRI